MKNPKIKSIKGLCEYIWYLEDKYDLLNLEINGVYPWAAFRMDLYYEIGRKSGIFDKRLAFKISKTKKIINLFKFIKNALLYNSSYNLKKVDTLVFTHPVSKLKNNKQIDIYTHFLINDFIQDDTSFLEFESPHKGNHIREKHDYKRYLDNIFIIRNLKNIFVHINLSTQTEETLTKLSNELNEEFNDYFNIKKVLISNVKKFIPTYNSYLKILQRTKPKKIYLVISYGRSELIKAAKDIGIEVIELQHGTFSRYHLGYSFPKEVNTQYFPDKFYVWNKYWKNLINLPIQADKVIIFPFQYLEIERKKYNHLKKEKHSLIIFSQGGITENILDKIIENITYFQKFNITFKLHPNEYHMISKYKSLIYLQKEYNIKVVTNIDLYEYLAKSEYQAGVFSTALYEGEEFNCKTILLDVSGIEYMDKFIENYNPIII